MHGTNQPLFLKEVYYHMSYLEFSCQILKWKEYTSSQLTTPVFNHLFTMTVEKLKAFLAILLVNGSAGLPRQEMYWERQQDCHNLVVSAMMQKPSF